MNDQKNKERESVIQAHNLFINIVDASISVAPYKRSFSKLRLIKLYLRLIIMLLERLNDLAMIHKQREQLKNLDYENLVKRVY